MSLNEEIAKSISNKFSPYGNPINKKLLTPCRQVGLSRKRKTPNSITKFSASPLEVNTPESYSTTPQNHKTSAKFETRSLSFDSPLVSDKRTVAKPALKSISKKSAKKTLTQRFSKDLFDESNDTNSDNEGDLASVLQVTVENNAYVNEDLCKLSKENDHVDINCESYAVKEKQSVCELFIRKSSVNYDSNDDHFEDKDCEKNKIKTKRKSFKDKAGTKHNSKTLKTENSDTKLAVGLKTCQMNIQRVSEAEIDINDSKINIENNIKPAYESDDDFVVAKRKKINLFISDDSDFQSTPENLESSNITKIQTMAIVHNSSENVSSPMSEKENKIMKVDTRLEKQSKGKTKNSVKTTDRKILSIIDDEDDDFTSTPEREKIEKIQLIEKIKFFENQVKQNRKKFDDLQQAAIYKSKHNVEELQLLTEKWRQGCILVLNSLLSNLQQHGPIDMITLLHNLHIPLDIVKSKLKINPEI